MPVDLVAPDDVRELGMSVEAMLDATAAIRAHADGRAEIFEQVWRDEVWQPFRAADMPEAAFDHLQATLAKVQSAAVNAVIGLFTIAMAQRITEGIAREIEHYRQPS